MASKNPPKKKASEEDLPLGVKSDYRVRKDKGTVTSHGDKTKSGAPSKARYGYTSITHDVEVIKPTFYESDLNRPATWSPAEVARLQSDLVNAGLLSKKGFSLGVFDDSTRSAYRQVLTYANRAGLTSIDEAMSLFLKSPKGGAGGGGSKRAPFTAELPNPEDVKAVIDATVPNILGRTLSDTEKQAVIAAYNSVVTGAQQTAYNAAESGGVVTQAPKLDTFAEQQAKQLHPDEADTFTKFKVTGDAMRLLGINAGGGSSG